MKIFTIIDNIITKNCDEFNIEDSEYTNFLVTRYLSMYSDKHVELLNNTINKFKIDEKGESYKFLYSIIPKNVKKYISYIKKLEKNKKNIDDVIVTKLAKCLEISKREVYYYIELNKIDINKIKRMFKIKNGE